MCGADGGRGAAAGFDEVDAKRDRGCADFFHPCAGRHLVAGAQRTEEFRIRPPQRRGMGGRGEPLFPAHLRMPHEVLHRHVGQGERARIKDHAGRVGVAEGEVDGFFPTDHASKKRKPSGLGMSKCAAPGLTVRGAGRILLFAVDQAIARAVERRRSARYAARQRRRFARTLVWVSAVFIGLAFASGFIWRSGWLHPPAADSVAVAVGEAERAEAYRLFDEAVRARHEERLQGAYNAINEARRLYPDLPGLDVLIGETAWEQREADTVRRAARESLRRGHNEASAKLLLALEKWMSRSPKDTVSVGASVGEMLVEAAEASPSNAPAQFFHGEVSRLLGDPANAHRKLLGALHRQTPWSGVSLLATKLKIAAAESSQLGRPAAAPPPDKVAQAVLDLRAAVAAGQNLRPAFDELLATTPSLQVVALLQDQTFAGSPAVDDVQRLREQLNPAVPRGVLQISTPR